MAASVTHYKKGYKTLLLKFRNSVNQNRMDLSFLLNGHFANFKH